MDDSNKIDIAHYSYHLPGSRIAKYPLEGRDQSKMLFYDRGQISQHPFTELPSLVPEGSWLVMNNTRVIQARMLFRKPSGARIEIFCLEPFLPSDYQQAFESSSSCSWKCLVGNAKKWKEGTVSLEVWIKSRVVRIEARIQHASGGDYTIQFTWNDPRITFGQIVENAGTTPIPPYLNREAEAGDKVRYQTIYSKDLGSVAAPTAGLHFTDRIIKELNARGTDTEEITLHVGAGTFVPVKTTDPRQHSMHAEHVVVSRSFLERWARKKGDLIAVGTTSARSMESLFWLGVKLIHDAEIGPGQLFLDQWENEHLPGRFTLMESLHALIHFCSKNQLEQLQFSTRLMIIPGYRFRVVKGLVTNFHLPGSTLLLLIAAYIGEDWQRVYDYALKHQFRFLSYGDSSLLLPNCQSD